MLRISIERDIFVGRATNTLEAGHRGDYRRAKLTTKDNVLRIIVKRKSLVPPTSF
jgi:hypothetical protein